MLQSHSSPLPRLNWAALTLALAWAAAVGGGYFVFVRTRWGQAVDGAAMADLANIETLHRVATVLGSVSVTTLLIGMGLAFLAGLLRRKPRLALGAAVAIGSAMVVTEVLKYVVFARPDYSIGWALPNSYPSGHSTAVAVVCLVGLVSVPRRWRAVFVPVAVVVPVMLGASMVSVEWHRPSDVAGAIGVATTALSVVMALLRRPPVGYQAAAENPFVPVARRRPSVSAWAGGAGWLAFLSAASLAGAVVCGWATRRAWDAQSVEFLVGDVSSASLGSADLAVLGLAGLLMVAAATGAVASALWAANRAHV